MLLRILLFCALLPTIGCSHGIRVGIRAFATGAPGPTDLEVNKIVSKTDELSLVIQTSARGLINVQVYHGNSLKQARPLFDKMQPVRQEASLVLDKLQLGKEAEGAAVTEELLWVVASLASRGEIPSTFLAEQSCSHSTSRGESKPASNSGAKPSQPTPANSSGTKTAHPIDRGLTRVGANFEKGLAVACFPFRR